MPSNIENILNIYFKLMELKRNASSRQSLSGSTPIQPVFNSKPEKNEQNLVVIHDNIYTSKNDNYTDKVVDKIFRIKQVNGTGYIDQLLVKSTSNDYTVEIMIDDRNYVNDTFSYFSDLSKYITNLSAFLKDGYYYLSIRNVQFQRNLLIAIKTTATLTFNEIVLNYSIRNERNR